MHPDRRRAGRAIRKQRRLAHSPGALAIAIKSLHGIGAATAAVGAAMLGFQQMVNTMVRLQQMNERLEMIRRAYAFRPATIERHDMTTVSITTSSTAPRDLIDHLVSYAQELESEGITVDVALIRTCIACDCTDDEACLGGCSWISEVDDLCTACDTPTNRQLLEERATERAARIDALIASITDTEPPHQDERSMVMTKTREQIRAEIDEQDRQHAELLTQLDEWKRETAEKQAAYVAEHREDWERREAALPEWAGARLRHVRENNPDFETELMGWGYELIATELAVLYAAMGEQIIGKSAFDIDDSPEVSDFANANGTSGFQHQWAVAFAQQHLAKEHNHG